MMPANPPFGMVFACFMVAIMIGSSLYTLLLGKGYAAEDTLRMSIALVSVLPAKAVLFFLYGRVPRSDWLQGCQILCFQTKNPNLVKFWRASD
jgi:hypothetical protein